VGKRSPPARGERLHIFQRRGGRGARSFHHLGQTVTVVPDVLREVPVGDLGPTDPVPFVVVGEVVRTVALLAIVRSVGGGGDPGTSEPIAVRVIGIRLSRFGGDIGRSQPDVIEVDLIVGCPEHDLDQTIGHTRRGGVVQGRGSKNYDRHCIPMPDAGSLANTTRERQCLS
jgi:hypothetical protein